MDRRENLIELNYAKICQQRVIDNIAIVGRIFKHLKRKGYRIKQIVLCFKDWNSYEKFCKEIGGVSGFVKHLRDYIDYHYGKIDIEYFAFAEFQQRQMIHWHIYIASNKYLHFENLGAEKFFTLDFSKYGYIFVKNLQFFQFPLQGQEYTEHMVQDALFPQLFFLRLQDTHQPLLDIVRKGRQH